MIALPDMLARQFDRDAIAIVEPGRRVTYAELDRRSETLAAELRVAGVARDVVAGVMLGRSAAAIIGALAVMKAGGAYLPIDPAQPADRCAFELRDAGADVVLTSADGPPPAIDGLAVLALDGDGNRVSRSGNAAIVPGRLTAATIAPEDLAYVIYTSGSTGRPKGVEITHAGLANLVAWHHAAFSVSAADRATHVCAVGFDAAVWEIWPYLARGATVAIPDPMLVRDPAALRDWLVASAVTIAFAPTALAEALVGLSWPAHAPLRLLLTGADTLHDFPPAGLPFSLVNNYGPTETTVVATSGPVAPRVTAQPAGEAPSIGRPIAGVEIVLVDADGLPVADGCPGEIWIGGAGVARGYRNAPELTAERFVQARFPGVRAVRFYRSGDLARGLPDGALQFLGRTDEQIKLRGFRIEPAEIEAALNAYPGIRASAVVARRFGPGDERLVAYIVTDLAAPPLVDIHVFLAGRLRNYMLPASVVRLPELPLTARGKLDRAALRTRPEAIPDSSAVADAPAASSLERRLIDLIATLGRFGHVSGTDNLVRLGAHSLLITQLIARIRDEFGVELSLRATFDAATIAELAREIEGLARHRGATRAIAPIPRRGAASHR